VIFYCFSAIAFWIVEIGFLFEGIRIVTILLSGGIFPVEVFGERALRVINLLPFKYTVSYPINVLNGRLTLAEAGSGLLIQGVWILISLLVARMLWQVGNKRYVAIGG
jgi:ABC-2 type transport system permease protein